MAGRLLLTVVLSAATACLPASGLSAQAPPSEPDPDLPPVGVADTRAIKEQLEAMNDSLVTAQEEILRLKRALTAGGVVGGGYVPSTDFMPPPASPNHPFRSELADNINLGAGSRVPGTSLIFRSAVDGSAQLTYDTGYIDAKTKGVFRPAAIALDGSAGAHSRGYFDLAASNATLNLDVQSPLQGTLEQAQGYLETDLLGGDLRVRHAFARVGDRQIALIAGKYWTAWGDEGAVPKALGTDLRPAGAVFYIPAQLRVAFSGPCGWVSTFALESPLNGDFEPVHPKDTVLQRYPDLTARLRYCDGEYASFSVGTLVRAMGSEAPNSHEAFAVGWGVSTAGRFAVGHCGAIMLGFVGGEGIAGAIYGLSPSTAAGGPSALGVAGDRLIPLTNYGTYIAYEHLWSDQFEASVAYGYAFGEGTPELTERKTQNAFANLIYKHSDNLAIGVEYAYGTYDTYDVAKGRTSGDNHRVLFVVALTTAKTLAERRRRASQADLPTLPVPSDSGKSKFSRL